MVIPSNSKTPINPVWRPDHPANPAHPLNPLRRATTQSDNLPGDKETNFDCTTAMLVVIVFFLFMALLLYASSRRFSDGI